MRTSPLQNLALAIFVTISVGWLLYIGKTILLPILLAVIVAYIIIGVADALHRLPVIRILPLLLLRYILLAGLGGMLIGLSTAIASMVKGIASASPEYQSNLLHIMDNIAHFLNLESEALWARVQNLIIEAVDLQAVAISAFGQLTRIGSAFFLVIFYTAFFLGDRGRFQAKVVAAFRKGETADRTLSVLQAMNREIRGYIAIKTLVNLILGVLCYGVLLICGVDFPLFWALLIALFNYIPYIGSYVAIAFPVLLSLAQFGTFETPLLVAVLLIGVQIFVGDFLEPKLIGRQMNLGAFVVLVALSVWSALWGIPGTILAVPLTSILAIALSSFEATRPVAIMMADRIDSEPETVWTP